MIAAQYFHLRPILEELRCDEANLKLPLWFRTELMYVEMIPVVFDPRLVNDILRNS